MNEKESLKDPNEQSSSKDTLPASPLNEDLDRPDLKIDKDAEREQATQEDETTYPKGIKLFLLA